MQRTKLVAFVVAAVALAAGGGLAVADAGAAQADTVTVELQVTNTEGGPVASAGATVEWANGSTEATTRSNGRVLVDVPAGADLDVSVEHPDYVRNVPARAEDVSADQTVDITMHPPATADIEIVDADGPVQNASVRLRRHGQDATAARGRTGSDGVWTSGEVEAGTYEVRVSRSGYYRVTREMELSGETSETIEIEEGEVTVDLLVRDPTAGGPGTLSADVDVRQDDQRIVSVTTSDAGRRAVALEVNTRYTVRVTREDYGRTTTFLTTGEEREEFAVNVTRLDTISMTAGNEQVVVGENLRVEVTDEYDRPVEGATVTVGGEAAGETDAQGVARVEIPEEGEVQVAASDDGMDAGPATVTGISASQSTDTGEQTDDSGDGGSDDGGDGTPGFGALAAVVAALLAVAGLASRR